MTTDRDPTHPTDDTPQGVDSLDRRSLLAGLGVLASGCAGNGATGAAGDTDTPTETVTAGSTITDATATVREPVVLAGTLPLSGSLSPIGVPLRQGLSVWAQQINAAGGLRRRPVDLRIEDDGGDPDAARQTYLELVDTADLLLAPYGSPATEAVIDVVESAGIPCIAHTAGDRSLWADGRQWTVQLLNPVDSFLHGLLTVTGRQGAESAAFLYRDDGFTPTVMQGAMRRAREDDWTITDEVSYTSTDGLHSTLTDITDIEPDLLVGGGFRPGAAGGGFLPDALALSRAYERVGGDAGLVNWAIGASFPAFREHRGETADGETGVTGWKAYVDYPGNAGFIERYREMVGTPPDAHAAQGYASGQVLAMAVGRAGTLGPPAVRRALFALRTTTVFGRYRVDDRGLQVGKSNAVVQWQDGDPIVVWPEQWRTGDLVYPS